MTLRWGLVAAVAVAAACAGDAPGTTIHFWALGREAEVVGVLLRDFETAHPDIHVAVEQLPFTTAHEKILTAFVGDATPDLAQLGNTWVPELALLGALAPLGPMAAASRDVRQDDYFAGIWDANVIDGQLYGVPWYVDTRLLFYRRDLLTAAGFAGPPASWSEWQRAMAAIKAEVGPDRYALLLPINTYDELVALGLQGDAPLLRDGDRWGNFRSGGFRRAFTFYLQAFRAGFAPVATSGQMSNPWEEFGRGYFTFFISGPWSIGELTRRLPAELQDRWATAPLPGPDGPGASTAGGSSLVIFRAARDKEAAWRVVEYLARPEVQRRFYDLIGDLPPRRSSWADRRLERARSAPPVPEWERIVTEMRIVSERAVYRAQGAPEEALPAIIDAALADLDARVDRILEKRRWVLARRGPK